jgi:hypothetical protein
VANGTPLSVRILPGSPYCLKIRVKVALARSGHAGAANAATAPFLGIEPVALEDFAGGRACRQLPAAMAR